MSSSPNLPSVQGLKMVSGSSRIVRMPGGATSLDLVTLKPLRSNSPASTACASLVSSSWIPTCSHTAPACVSSCAAALVICCASLCLALASPGAFATNRLTERRVSSCLPI
eukprot:3167070-Pleurochrysis_carterae.AAC.2